MKKKLFALVLAWVLCIGVSVPVLAAGEFPDVPADHYAHDAIQAAARGITSGYSDGTFRPNSPVTNAQFTVMTARAFFPEDLAEFQTQAEGKSWHWAAYKALEKNKSLAGFSFEHSEWPDRAGLYMTRYDMALMAYRTLYAKLANRGHVVETEDENAAKSKIADYDSIKSIYQVAVSSVYALGIMSGYPDGTFGGENAVNRAQACAVIARMFERLEDQLKTVQFPEVVLDPAKTSVAVGSNYYDQIGQ